MVYNKNLHIVPHPSPHPRHANIVNWPNEESSEHRKAKAVLLAQQAKLIVRHSTNVIHFHTVEHPNTKV